MLPSDHSQMQPVTIYGSPCHCRKEDDSKVILTTMEEKVHDSLVIPPDTLRLREEILSPQPSHCRRSDQPHKNPCHRRWLLEWDVPVDIWAPLFPPFVIVIVVVNIVIIILARSPTPSRKAERKKKGKKNEVQSSHEETRKQKTRNRVLQILPERTLTHDQPRYSPRAARRALHSP